MSTVAHQFAATLAAAGVKRIYGVIGDSLNGLTDALRRQGKIEWVHVRHEEVAAFAAGAEAHMTGALASGFINTGTELAMPPSITAEMAKGFTLYMVKAVMSGRGDEVIDLARTNLWR